jgi:hypothetical protein
MISVDLLCTVRQLSVKDKLLLIQFVSSLLSEDLPTKQDNSERQNGSSAQNHWQTLDDVDDNMALVIAKLLSRPNPTPEQMLPRGLFKGQLNLSEEDFRIAEWHPSDKELLGE